MTLLVTVLRRLAWSERKASTSSVIELQGPLHIVAASRGLRLLLRASPALPAAGEADDRARTMVSVA